MAKPLKFSRQPDRRSKATRFRDDASKCARPNRLPLPKLRRLRAKFVDKDGRYARVSNTTYPVLLSSCRASDGYVEDMRDDDEYPAEWCRQFRANLDARAAAVLVSDADDSEWTFLGLFQVYDVQLSNFLTCKIGPKLTKLKLL